MDKLILEARKLSFEMNIDLKDGQQVSFVLYKGTSNVEAKSIYDYLNVNQKNKTPIPLKGSNFSLLIDDILTMETPIFSSLSIIYRIEVKGKCILNCKYCGDGVALVNGETNDYGIAIQYPNILKAYGYDVHGYGTNGIGVKINYCPMCGRELKGDLK